MKCKHNTFLFGWILPWNWITIKKKLNECSAFLAHVIALCCGWIPQAFLNSWYWLAIQEAKLKTTMKYHFTILLYKKKNLRQSYRHGNMSLPSWRHSVDINVWRTDLSLCSKFEKYPYLKTFAFRFTFVSI